MSFLSPTQAADVARRGRQLLQDGEITHHQHSLLTVLLWRCRKHGQAAACASYSALQRLANQARGTVAGGLKRFQELGLVQKVKHRVRVSWAGGQASRQGTNSYVFFAAATEFTGRTVVREIEIQVPEEPGSVVRKAQEALARRRQMMEQRWRGM